MSEKYVLSYKSAEGDKDNFVKVERDTTAFSQRHKHTFIEVVCFYKGVGKHIIDDKEYTVKGGDVFILNAGTAHQFSGSELCAINIMFYTEYFDKDLDANRFIQDFVSLVFKDKAEIFANMNFLYVPDYLHGSTETTLLNVLQEYNRKNDGYNYMIRSGVTSLVIGLFRKHIDERFGNDKKSFYEKIIEQVIMYIDENIKDITKTKDVTDTIGYNALYFSRIFSEYMDISISEYIRRKKIEYACRLLINTDYTVEKICEDIGYSDIKNFYKTFKKITSKTPSEYKNSLVKK